MAAKGVVVVDNGTGFVKAGFAADNLPRYMFPSIVGRPVLRAEEEAIGDVDLKPITVGEEAAALRRALEISYPLENGIIRNWEDMGHVWSYLFTERMGIDPKEHRILLTEAPMNPRENRRKMIETMFEKYGFHSLQVSIQAMLTLYAQGLLSGCVLDSGDGVTHIVAVYDGFELSNLTKRLDVAGRHITRYLIKLLLTRGYAFNRSADFQTVQELKERFAYVALDIAKERKLAEETTVLVEKYTLPDGRTIKIGHERFEAAEALFNPALVEVEGPGMSDLVFDVINSAEVDLRTELYSHVVLSGGSTMYPGLPSRLEHDLRQRYTRDILKGDVKRLSKFKLHIEDPPRRKHMVFLGASVLGEIMAGRDEYWLKKSEYEEHGAQRLMDKYWPVAGGGRVK